jgi:hypothetical protein
MTLTTHVVDPLGPEGAVASAQARNVEPFEAVVIGYDTVILTWTSPAVGSWSGIQVVRSRSGFPRTVADGLSVFLFDHPNWNEINTFTADGLVGGYHYFTLFLRDAFGWQRVAEQDVLVPYDYSSTDRMWDTLPEYYRVIRDDTADISKINLRVNPALYNGLGGGEEPNLLLSAFISLFGWGFDLLRTQAEFVGQGYNPTTIHQSRLKLLSQQFGHELEPAVPTHVNRTIVRNLASLYRRRGTLDGIHDILSAVSGWDVEVTLGKNMLLSEDQSAHTNPDPGMAWLSTVRYVIGDVVRHGDFTFEALQDNLDSTPPATATSNADWRYLDYPDTRPSQRPDTGDINTWQARLSTGPSLSTPVAGLTVQVVGAPDITGVKQHQTAMRVHRPVGTDGADFLDVVSVPALSTPTKTARQFILESGIPIPRPGRWEAERTYQAGEFVLYKGAAYEALNVSVNVVPTITTDWVRVGADDRIMFTSSSYAHGPFVGTAGTGGKVVRPQAYMHNADGTVAQKFEFTTSTVVPVFDPFVDDSTALTGSRVTATGHAWVSDNVGAWTINRDDNGGWSTPPATGKAQRWVAPSWTTFWVGVTFTTDPGTTRLVGLVFRRTDTNNYWIATQTGLYKRVAGAALAAPASGALTWTKFTAGERMKVFVDGNTISVYRNNTLLGTATDSFNNTAGQPGLGAEA